MSSKVKLGFVISTFIISGCVITTPSLVAETDISDFYENAESEESSKKNIEFTFAAFGDSGWAETHDKRPTYSGNFKKAFLRFDPNKKTLGDINYINWETSVGSQCDQFWSQQSPSAYAFLTHPQELKDAIGLGFNVIGLANNHTFDCLSSKEGNGPLQSHGFVEDIRQNKPNIAMSGVFTKPQQEPIKINIKTKKGDIPITFLSAYVGGHKGHCLNMSCLLNASKYTNAFTDKKRLRIVALHSWNKSTHNELKIALKNWVSSNLVDIAIGTGPHIAENIEVVKTDYGNKIIATSLGNFIHPSLSPQVKNVALQTKWNFDKESKDFSLLKVEAVKISCDGGECRDNGNFQLF